MKSLSLSLPLRREHRRLGTRGGSRPLGRAPAARAGLGPGETPAQVAKAQSGRFPALARDASKADQIAAFDRDVAADVAPEQVVERRPPQQRAQHPPAIGDAPVLRSDRAEWSCRPSASAKGARSPSCSKTWRRRRPCFAAAFPRCGGRGVSAPGGAGRNPDVQPCLSSKRQACPVTAGYSMLARPLRTDHPERAHGLLICRATRK